MANFTVNSASTLYSGTDLADAFLINTAASITVNGLGGDDVITAGLNPTFNGSLLTGGDGADTFNLNAGSNFSATTVQGGAGTDTFTISGGAAVGLVLQAGTDVDTITLTNISLTNSTIGAGGSIDTFAGDSLTVQNTRIQAGAGADNATFSASTVRGNSFLSSTFELGGGDDFLNVSAVLTNVTIGGGAGDDTITAAVNNATNISIGGGAGNDIINLTALPSQNFGTIQGGGGTDTIDLDGVANSDGGLLFGGAGADTIRLSGGAAADAAIVVGTNAINAASGQFISYSAFSESTLGSNQGVGTMDTINGTMAVSGSVFTLNALVNGFSFASVISGNYSNGATLNASGQWAFGNDAASLTTLASRVGVLDTQLAGMGQAASFTDANGARFLFVQGGTSGTADDLLVGVGITGISGGITLGYSSSAQMKVFVAN